jgi:hypothetical protein
MPVLQDQAMRMFRACEAAGASTMIMGWPTRAGFLYHKDSGGGYTLGFDEGRVRNSPAFREIWDVDFPLERLTARRRATQWGFMNQDAVNAE